MTQTRERALSRIPALAQLARDSSHGSLAPRGTAHELVIAIKIVSAAKRMDEMRSLHLYLAQYLRESATSAYEQRYPVHAASDLIKLAIDELHSHYLRSNFATELNGACRARLAKWSCVLTSNLLLNYSFAGSL